MTKAVCVVRASGSEGMDELENRAAMHAGAAHLIGVQVVRTYCTTRAVALSDADVDAIVALMAKEGSNYIVMWSLLTLADARARKRLSAILDRLPDDTFVTMMGR